MRKHLTASLLAAAALLCSCNANIVGQNDDKLLAPLTPTYAGGVPDPWYLYDDSLKTNEWLRGLDFFSGGGFSGTPVIDPASTTNPDRGTSSFHFGVGAQTGSWYCGMILLQGNGFGDSGTRPGVDLTVGGFTKCVFRARAGAGAPQVKFEVLNATNNLTTTLSMSWQTYTIPFTTTTALSSVKQFFDIVFANASPASGSPVDVYVDDLRFSK